MSELDVSGEVLSAFTRVNEPDIWWPRHLSTDSEDRVFVADWGNLRILLLSLKLQQERVLVETNTQVKLWRPERLYYNELTSQLYVVHSSSNEWFLFSDVISIFSLR